MRPGVTARASLNARISVSDAHNDGMILASQIQSNSNCINDLVANDIVILVSNDIVILV